MVSLLKLTFSHFKQHYTHFHTLFHPHVFQKTKKNHILNYSTKHPPSLLNSISVQPSTCPDNSKHKSLKLKHTESSHSLSLSLFKLGFPSHSHSSNWVSTVSLSLIPSHSSKILCSVAPPRSVSSSLRLSALLRHFLP